MQEEEEELVARVHATPEWITSLIMAALPVNLAAANFVTAIAALPARAA
jgi:hypothetical protein